MKITSSIKATPNEIERLEMHSVVNIISVISSQLQLIQMECNHPEILDEAVARAADFADACNRKDQDVLNEQSIESFQKLIDASLKRLKQRQPVLNDDTRTDEYVRIFQSIFEVFEVRLRELVQRWEKPDEWLPFDIKQFRNDFREFFYSMEKNSRGRYKIIYNIAEQEKRDYLVNFAIDSEMNGTIYMPLILKDVIRDLVANARKYTPPGEGITVGISQKEDLLRLVVEDSGVGIPKDEIEKVVDYGYRASNVRESVRTMGGGFGLTKAYHVTQQYNGEMWIESELGEGTKIRVEIPIPEDAIQ
jgi:signal transduction histidine kinase